MRDRAYDLAELPEIDTPRVRLRALTDADAPAYFALCRQGEMMASYGLPAHETEAASLATIRLLARWFEGGRALRWGIFPRETPGVCAGDIGYWQFDLIRHRGELGVKIDPARAGRGLGYEVMRAVIDFGFEALGLTGVDANISPANPASLRLAEKLGFVAVGTRPALGRDPVTGAVEDRVFLTMNRPASGAS